jgi:hypothetical protein
MVFLLLALCPLADAQMTIGGVTLGAGVTMIISVVVFLFIVPCISKVVHVIRKFCLHIQSHSA